MTPQETYDHIAGSGAFTYSWYVRCQIYGVNHDGDVVPNWYIIVRLEDPDDSDKQIRVVLTHEAIIGHAYLITTDNTGKFKVSSRTILECVNLLRDPDDADFDANDADEFIQSFAYGEVVFG